MSPIEHPTALRRRSVVVGAAWTTPVIVIAAAAPAMAASVSGTFAISAGTSSVSNTEYYKALNFRSFTIVPSKAIPASGLSLTITFSGVRSGNPTTTFYVDSGVPGGWARLTPGTPDFSTTSVVYSYLGAPSAGSTVSVPNNSRGNVSAGYYVDCNGASSGAFTLTAAATGFTSSSVTISLGAARGAGGADPRSGSL